MSVCPKCNANFTGTLKYCNVDGTTLIHCSDEVYLPLGEVINDELSVIARLHTDRLGVLYQVSDNIITGRSHALRLFHPQFANDALFTALDILGNSLRERLDAPEIITDYEVIELPDGRRGLLSESCEGYPLHDILAHEAPLPTRHTISILLQLAETLNVAHTAGFIHGGLTPDNLISASHTGEALANWPKASQIKLIDFAVGRMILINNPQFNNFYIEELKIRNYHTYCAPELATGDIDQMGVTSDIYSLGALCYHMLSGKPPYVNNEQGKQTYITDDPRPLMMLKPERNIPGSLERIMLKALSRSVSARQQSLAELMEELQDVYFNLAVLAPAAATLPPPLKLEREKISTTQLIAQERAREQHVSSPLAIDDKNIPTEEFTENTIAEAVKAETAKYQAQQVVKQASKAAKAALIAPKTLEHEAVSLEDKQPDNHADKQPVASVETISALPDSQPVESIKRLTGPVNVAPTINIKPAPSIETAVTYAAQANLTSPINGKAKGVFIEPQVTQLVSPATPDPAAPLSAVVEPSVQETATTGLALDKYKKGEWEKLPTAEYTLLEEPKAESRPEPPAAKEENRAKAITKKLNISEAQQPVSAPIPPSWDEILMQKRAKNREKTPTNPFMEIPAEIKTHVAQQEANAGSKETKPATKPETKTETKAETKAVTSSESSDLQSGAKSESDLNSKRVLSISREAINSEFAETLLANDEQENLPDYKKITNPLPSNAISTPVPAPVATSAPMSGATTLPAMPGVLNASAPATLVAPATLATPATLAAPPTLVVPSTLVSSPAVPPTKIIASTETTEEAERLIKKSSASPKAISEAKPEVRELISTPITPIKEASKEVGESLFLDLDGMGLSQTQLSVPPLIPATKLVTPPTEADKILEENSLPISKDKANNAVPPTRVIPAPPVVPVSSVISSPLSPKIPAPPIIPAPPVVPSTKIMPLAAIAQKEDLLATRVNMDPLAAPPTLIEKATPPPVSVAPDIVPVTNRDADSFIPPTRVGEKIAPISTTKAGAKPDQHKLDNQPKVASEPLINENLLGDVKLTTEPMDEKVKAQLHAEVTEPIASTTEISSVPEAVAALPEKHSKGVVTSNAAIGVNVVANKDINNSDEMAYAHSVQSADEELNAIKKTDTLPPALTNKMGVKGGNRILRWLAVITAGMALIVITTVIILITFFQPSLGALTITTSPTGGQIWLDGRFYAEAPAKLEDVPTGPHHIKITKTGYLPLERDIVIIKKQTVILPLLTLQPDRPIEVESDTTGTPELRIKEFTRLAEDAFSRGDYVTPVDNNALYFINAVLAINQNDKYANDMRQNIKQALLKQIDASQQRNDFANMLLIYNQIIDKFPEDTDVPEALNKLETLLDSRRGQLSQLLQQGEAAFKNGRYIEPVSSSAYYFAAQASAIERGNPAAIRLRQRVKDALINEAEMFNAQGDIKIALERYEKLARLFPEDRRFVNQIAALNLKINQPVIAPTNDPKRRRDTGIQKYYSGDYNGAIADLELVVKSGMQDTETLYTLASALLKRGRTGEATRFFNQILEANANHGPTLISLAQLAEARKDFTMALNLYERVLRSGVGEFSSEVVKERIETLKNELKPKEETIKPLQPVFFSAQVVHSHTFGSCRGTLQVNEKGVRFFSANSEHSFNVPLNGISELKFGSDELGFKLSNSKRYEFKLLDHTPQNFQQSYYDFLRLPSQPN